MTVQEPYLVQPAAGVHAYVQPDGGWCLNNAGFVSDGGRTLLVDTAPPGAGPWRCGRPSPRPGSRCRARS